jgi:hypothetical protein
MSIKTVSLETSKLLKEAGFPQDSHHSWEIIAPHLKGKCVFITERPHIDNEQYSAPTTDELLAELPWELNGDCLVVEKGSLGWLVKYGKEFQLYDSEKSLPDVLAQMWLLLPLKESRKV